MENHLNDSKPLNVKGIILLVGTVFSALIAAIACGTIYAIITGILVGLLFAAIFISVLLPHKESDR